MSSFERLFKLAKKTGDRMIVFDSAIGDGFAAIPIDEYEAMMTDPRDVMSLSGDELLEQINDDIAIWRAHQEATEREEFADILEEKLADEPPFDPFVEDFAHKPEWHSTGDVLQDRYKKPSFDWLEDDDDDDDLGLFDYHEPADHERHRSRYEDPAVGVGEEEDFFGDTEEEDEEMTVETLPFDPPMPQSIPPATERPLGDWQEEPLDEEP